MKTDNQLRQELYEFASFLVVASLLTGAVMLAITLISIPWYGIQSWFNARTEAQCLRDGGSVVRQYGKFSKCIVGQVRLYEL